MTPVTRPNPVYNPYSGLDTSVVHENEYSEIPHVTVVNDFDKSASLSKDIDSKEKYKRDTQLGATPSEPKGIKKGSKFSAWKKKHKEERGYTPVSAYVVAGSADQGTEGKDITKKHGDHTGSSELKEELMKTDFEGEHKESGTAIAGVVVTPESKKGEVHLEETKDDLELKKDLDMEDDSENAELKKDLDMKDHSEKPEVKKDSNMTDNEKPEVKKDSNMKDDTEKPEVHQESDLKVDSEKPELKEDSDIKDDPELKKDLDHGITDNSEKPEKDSDMKGDTQKPDMKKDSDIKDDSEKLEVKKDSDVKDDTQKPAIEKEEKALTKDDPEKSVLEKDQVMVKKDSVGDKSAKKVSEDGDTVAGKVLKEKKKKGSKFSGWRKKYRKLDDESTSFDLSAGGFSAKESNISSIPTEPEKKKDEKLPLSHI